MDKKLYKKYNKLKKNVDVLIY